MSHPYYRCPKKEEGRQVPKKCYRCGSIEHKISECTNNIVCHFCHESGHKKADCEEQNKVLARSEFDEYAYDILEGRQDTLNESMTDVVTPFVANVQRESVRVSQNKNTEPDMDHAINFDIDANAEMHLVR